jgi:hypothetical protein
VWFQNAFSWSWLPLSEINALVELRIFHAIFCDQYKIQRSALSFDLYLEHVYEKLLGDVLDIHPLSWGMVCTLALLNWGFGVAGKSESYCMHETAHESGTSTTSETHRRLGGSSSTDDHNISSAYEECLIKFSVRAFTYAGERRCYCLHLYLLAFVVISYCSSTVLVFLVASCFPNR